MQASLYRSLALLVTLAGTTAQSPILTVFGDGAGQRFGSALRGIGDADGDGFVDFVVGADLDGRNGVWSGRVRVVSGRDGRALHDVSGSAAGDRFGLAVGAAGDVDGDGRADFVAGSPYDDRAGTDAGSATVLSGRDASVLWRFVGTAPFEQLGWSVGSAGDVDRDGRPDVLVTAPFADGGSVRAGIVIVYSGRSGAVLHRIVGAAEEHFGWAATTLGDVDNDQHDDFAASALEPFGTGKGIVRAYSGRTGAPLWSVQGAVFNGSFGQAIDGGRDVNGDGRPDIVVGHPGRSTFGFHSGGMDVLSGVDGSRIHTIDGTRAFQEIGHSVAMVGDMDGDSRADFAAGSSVGSFYVVHSGASGAPLFTEQGSGLLGSALAPAGDVDKDGRADLCVAAPRAGDNGLDSGTVRIVANGVRALSGNRHTVSVSAGGMQALALDAGASFAGRSYLLVGSLSGIEPGTQLGAVRVPLVFDFYTIATASNPNAPPLVGSFGTLDANGRASAAFALPPNSSPGLVGIRVDHAWITLPLVPGLFDFASNSVPVRLVP